MYYGLVVIVAMRPQLRFCCGPARKSLNWQQLI